jgi:hypothetical protein
VHQELTDSLASLERDGGNTIETYRNAIDLAAHALAQLRSHVVAHGFASAGEEITFFKRWKPAIEHLQVYYRELLEMALGTVVPGSWEVTGLQEKLEKIRSYFTANAFLVKYYRSGDTYLDDKLFVRSMAEGSWQPFPAPGDTIFHAVCDRFVAILLAYEKLHGFIHHALQGLSTGPALVDKFEKKFKWTDSKAALIELLYALQRKGSINNGQAELKDIAQFLEGVFGVDLGNYYRTFQEIRIRKSGRTNYLDQLKATLIRYMDETDLEYGK